MKKVIFMMGVAALALASCSNEEQLGVNTGKAITFRQAMASRATETTVVNLTEFNVTSYKGSDVYFADKFSGVENGSYTASKEYYWPGDNSTLTFYAYAPTGLSGVSMASDGITVTDFSPADKIADQIDFVSASNTGNKGDNEGSGVELTFAHNLAQIEIRAFSNNEVYDFEISGIKIACAKSQGTFTKGDWSFADNAPKASYESSCTAATLAPLPESGNAPSFMGSDGNAMLIPQELVAWTPDTENRGNADEGAYIAVKLKITTKDNGTVVFPFTGKDENGDDASSVWAAVPVNTKWEAGNKYIYTLDFSKGAGYVDPEEPVLPDEPILGNPITFTVKVISWTDSTNELNLNMDTNN